MSEKYFSLKEFEEYVRSWNFKYKQEVFYLIEQFKESQKTPRYIVDASACGWEVLDTKHNKSRATFYGSSFEATRYAEYLNNKKEE